MLKGWEVSLSYVSGVFEGKEGGVWGGRLLEKRGVRIVLLLGWPFLLLCLVLGWCLGFGPPCIRVFLCFLRLSSVLAPVSAGSMKRDRAVLTH